MSVEKQLQSIMNSINSLENSLGDLQNHANILHDVTNMNVATDFDPDAELHSDFSSKLEEIKSHVMDKSNHLENIILTGLDPNIIQAKMDIMAKTQNRMNYYRGRR